MLVDGGLERTEAWVYPGGMSPVDSPGQLQLPVDLSWGKKKKKERKNKRD